MLSNNEELELYNETLKILVKCFENYLYLNEVGFIGDDIIHYGCINVSKTTCFYTIDPNDKEIVLEISNSPNSFVIDGNYIFYNYGVDTQYDITINYHLMNSDEYFFQQSTIHDLSIVPNGYKWFVENGENYLKILNLMEKI